MRLRFKPRVLGLLEGAIDLHIHSAPDVYPRILNDIELARQAQEMGMRAIVVKNHFVDTSHRAQMASQEAGFPVFGGVALNLGVGGLNPMAVDYSLKLGGKIVWMPTLHSRNHLANKDHVTNLASALGNAGEGIYLLNEDGILKEEVCSILDLIAQHDAVLATGHVDIPEAKAVVREAVNRGVKRIVVTHPLASFVGYSIDDMKEILELGATYLEHVFNDTTRQVGHPISIGALHEAMLAVGPEHCIMSTDAGQWLNPIPVQQMGIFIEEMLGLGWSEQAVRTMVADNPAKLLGI